MEFKDAVKEEEREWIQDKLKSDYSFKDLPELVRVTYNNQVDQEGWIKLKTKDQDQPQFLALAMESSRS